MNKSDVSHKNLPRSCISFTFCKIFAFFCKSNARNLQEFCKFCLTDEPGYPFLVVNRRSITNEPDFSSFLFFFQDDKLRSVHDILNNLTNFSIPFFGAIMFWEGEFQFFVIPRIFFMQKMDLWFKIFCWHPILYYIGTTSNNISVLLTNFSATEFCRDSMT